MHKYRKIIGVLISLADGIYQKKFIEGIQRQAYELDYDVLVFSSFIKVCSSKPWLIGEKKFITLLISIFLTLLLSHPIRYRCRE